MSDTPPATILIVDDARLNRALLETKLAGEGYRFVQAANGQEAVARLADNPEIDLILLDLIMPGMDGYAFLQWRASNPRAQKVPVIVNSSLDDFDSIVRALQMDSYDYFTKPLSDDDLRYILPLKIRNAVNSKRLMEETTRQNEMMQQELDLAARYQGFLLPDDSDLPGVRITFHFQPCSKVGGDYFDFLEIGQDKVGFVVADVSGHGVAAAMTASIVKALLPGYLAGQGSPGRALEALNDDLVRLTQEDSFVTCFAAIYDRPRQVLTWSTAGHPPAIFLRPGRQPEQLVYSSMFLGVFASDQVEVAYADQALPVAAGDRLVLYTDGLTENPNPAGEQFGLQRLEKIVAQGGNKTIEELKRYLQASLVEFSRGVFPDDVAIILAEF